MSFLQAMCCAKNDKFASLLAQFCKITVVLLIFIRNSEDSALAQVSVRPPSPITVTPRVLAPREQGKTNGVEIPDAVGIRAPEGAESLDVSPASVDVSGEFPELAEARERIFAPLLGRTSKLSELYAATSALEAAYARKGYVLVRLAILPQRIEAGGTFRIGVIDGFVESLDLTAIPSRLRRPVRAALSGIVGRHHVRLATIEQALLLAGDTPGAALRTTLMRGDTPGGTRLVVNADYDPFSVTLATRNDYDPSLGTWGFSTEFVANSVLGLGETLYGFAASDVDDPFSDAGHVRVLGGGAIARLAQARLSLNPEATFSRTRPNPLPGAPRTIGQLQRYTLRSAYVIARRRQFAAQMNLTVEELDVRNNAPDFSIDLSHDRYRVARLGGSLNWPRKQGARASLSVEFSQGLGDFGARSQARVLAEDVPYSREGARNDFSLLQVDAHVLSPLGPSASLALFLKGQTSFGRPVFRTEQVSLEGEGGLSAYVGGVTAADSGAVGRVEIANRIALDPRTSDAVSPYAFVAAGAGRIERPSLVEPGAFGSVSLGLGTRCTIGNGRIRVGAEYAYAYSDYHPLNQVQRVSLTLGLNI